MPRPSSAPRGLEMAGLAFLCPWWLEAAGWRTWQWLAAALRLTLTRSPSRRRRDDFSLPCPVVSRKNVRIFRGHTERRVS